MRISVEYIKGVGKRAWQKDNRKMTMFISIVSIVAVVIIISSVF